MEKALKYALSDSDIKSIIPNCNLVSYPEIEDYDSIDELLGPGKMCVILYMLNKNRGHWTCIFKTRGGLEFFDPYAIKPDHELQWNTESKMRRLHMMMPLLSNLILKSHYRKIYYLDHRIQRMSNNISTCGRQVVCRLLNKKIPLKEYETKLRNPKGDLKGYTPDELSVLITFPFLGK